MPCCLPFGNAGGLQILRCQGFEVNYYDFTLDALTLKPSDVCNVGVNSRRLCDFSNVKDTVRPYRNFCSDFLDDVVWFFFCFKSRLMAKCHLFQGIVSIPLGDRSYGPGGEVTFYPQMLPLNDMQHFVKVNNVLICQISAYKNSVFPGNALNIPSFYFPKLGDSCNCQRRNIKSCNLSVSFFSGAGTQPNKNNGSKKNVLVIDQSAIL